MPPDPSTHSRHGKQKAGILPPSQAAVPYPNAHKSAVNASSTAKYHYPYFSHAELDALSEKQRGKQSATQEEKVRQTACTFLDTIGARVGFPRRTIATSQMLYNRFHLFYPRKDFQYYEVALAALFVSTKMHDTLKKTHELLAISYALRFPELAAKSKQPSGGVDIDSMDQAMVEADKQRLLAVERLILETICFNFTARMPFPYVIKIAKRWGADKRVTKMAWRICVDCYRTMLPLIYPPATLACASIFTASLLLSHDQPHSETDSAQKLSRLNLNWTSDFGVDKWDLQDFAHTFLDLLLQFIQTPSSTSTSPSTPSSPSPNLTSSRDRHLHQQNAQQQYPFKPDQIIQIKIQLRERDYYEAHDRTWKKRELPGQAANEAQAQAGGAASSSTAATQETPTPAQTGQNEKTTRFLFFPPGMGTEAPPPPPKPSPKKKSK